MVLRIAKVSMMYFSHIRLVSVSSRSFALPFVRIRLEDLAGGQFYDLLESYRIDIGPDISKADDPIRLASILR